MSETNDLTSFSAQKVCTTLTFSTYPTIYQYNRNKNKVKMNNNKRQYRELNDSTKQKISNSSRNKPKSEQHKQHISQAMIDYWQTVPNRPNDETTTDDIV